MQRFEYQIKIKIKAPFLFPSASTGMIGYSAITSRDCDGRLVIPREQIRGVVLHELHDLSKAGSEFGQVEIEALFGREANEFKPNPGRIFFSDLKTGEAIPISRHVQPRQAEDEETGANRDGFLIMNEQVTEPGNVVEFAGCVVWYDENDSASVHIQTALDSIIAIGQDKTIGFGFVECIAFEPLLRQSAQVENRAEKRLFFELNFDRPYLVNSNRVDANHFVGQFQIPGGAIKGCLARNLELRGIDYDADELANIRVSHSQPDKPIIPASCYFERDDAQIKIYDFYSQRECIDPVFKSDWKPIHFETFAKATNVDVVEYRFEDRLHVEICRESLGAKEGQLFRTLAVQPQIGRPLIAIEFPSIKSATAKAVRSVLSKGLDGMGRTEAFAEFVELNMLSSKSTPSRFVIMETDALLAQADSGKSALESYGDFWREQGFPKLRSMFIETNLAGGYLAQRYFEKKRYEPFMLTKAGSVFEFESEMDDSHLEKLAHGICAKKWGAQENNWENCPFMPENGYGAARAYIPLNAEGLE